MNEDKLSDKIAVHQPTGELNYHGLETQDQDCNQDQENENTVLRLPRHKTMSPDS